MWNRSSSFMEASKSRREVSTRKRERTRWNTSNLLRSRVQSRGNRRNQPVPASSLLAKAAASGGGQGVVFCPAVVLALSPIRGDEALVLQPVERRIQRSLRNFKRIAGNLPDTEQDAVSMQRL